MAANPAGWLALAPGAPDRRRVAASLMNEMARDSGGRFAEDPGTGALLLAAPEPALERAALALGALFGPEALSRASAPPAPPRLPAPPRPLLDEAPAAAPEPAPVRHPIVGLGPDGWPRLAGLRLGAPREAPAGVPGHLWRHATDGLLRAIGGGLATAEGRAALLGEAVGVPLHLQLPAGGLHPDEAAALADLPVLPLLPLAALVRGAEPPAGLFALDVPEAAVLAFLDPAALPGAAIHLRWDDALPELAAAAVPALGAGRIVLEGVENEAALRWGLEQGIGRFAGGHPSRLLAALRRRFCPDGARCAPAGCAARAAAAEPGGRRGCTQPALLLRSPGEAPGEDAA